MSINQVEFKDTSKIIDKLIALSKQNHHDVFNDIVWPEKIEDDQFWMSPSLLSVHDTELKDTLTLAQLKELSKWECINFFSLNVNGIKDLLSEIVKFIYSKGFEDLSEYLHFFFKEENEHMYYFAKFSLKYGGKIYKDKWMSSKNEFEDDINSFLVFARIVSFECLVDYYNFSMSKDQELCPIIQEINRLHHKDESRHIAFGITLIKNKFEEIQKKYPQERVEEVRKYVLEYIKGTIELFYNPTVYKDAGIENPYEFRAKLLKTESRRNFNNHLVQKCFKEFINSNILTTTNIF